MRRANPQCQIQVAQGKRLVVQEDPFDYSEQIPKDRGVGI
jgi:hypothetical protein